jgi:hypothetical protein
MTKAVTLAGLGSTNPILTAPVLGTPVSGSLENCTGVQYTGFKNRIINGGMEIDQRNAGASVTPASLQYLVDRWQFAGSVSSKFTAQQNAGAVTPPVGFIKYQGLTSSSTYSVLAGDYFLITQLVEGFNCTDLAWGTANAQTVTLSFRVYSSLTGTFGGAIGNSDQTRNYPFTYSIPVANTWTTASVTIAGDTTGTWLTTNSIGIRVRLGLGVGSTYSGTAGAWSSSLYLSATGATSVVGTSGATFYITGVQLEKGSTATSFDYRPYGTELALCQRYYQRNFGNGVVSHPYSVSAVSLRFRTQVPMRATFNPNQISGSSLTSCLEQIGAGPNTPTAIIALSGKTNSAFQVDFSGTFSLDLPTTLNADIIELNGEL